MNQGPRARCLASTTAWFAAAAAQRITATRLAASFRPVSLQQGGQAAVAFSLLSYGLWKHAACRIRRWACNLKAWKDRLYRCGRIVACLGKADGAQVDRVEVHQIFCGHSAHFKVTYVASPKGDRHARSARIDKSLDRGLSVPAIRLSACPKHLRYPLINNRLHFRRN